jgi:hypothetical protein
MPHCTCVCAETGNVSTPISPEICGLYWPVATRLILPIVGVVITRPDCGMLTFILPRFALKTSQPFWSSCACESGISFASARPVASSAFCIEVRLEFAIE